MDISGRKQAEQEIRQLNAELESRVKIRTAQLEAANRDLESFTYSVSHDLRAPLRHMDGFTRILVEEFGDQLPPGAKQHLARVRAATLHMGRLVDDLLNLARVGRGSLKIAPTDLNALVAEIIQSLEAETRGRDGGMARGAAVARAVRSRIDTAGFFQFAFQRVEIYEMPGKGGHRNRRSPRPGGARDLRSRQWRRV